MTFPWYSRRNHNLKQSTPSTPSKNVCSLAAQKGTWQWRDAVHVKRDWVFHRLQKGSPEHSIANPVPLELEPFSWFREGSELSSKLKNHMFHAAIVVGKPFPKGAQRIAGLWGCWFEDVNGWCQAVQCPSAADLHFLIIKPLVKKYPKLTSTSDDVKRTSADVEKKRGTKNTNTQTHIAKTPRSCPTDTVMQCCTSTCLSIVSLCK